MTAAAWNTGSTTVEIETGRGTRVSVDVGRSFTEAIRDVARRANYGGSFRVFVDGEEVVNPTDAPATIEEGMDIRLTSYDKVGQ